MPRDSADRLNPDDVLKAYALGYFPMARARDADHVVWVLPDIRGVLPLDRARAPRRLLKELKRARFDVTFNTAFARVIAACAEARDGREETWINDQIAEAYTELHYRGDAHSVECWRGGALVGGLYGVAIGGVFCGESMFSIETNASKIAFLYLVARLKAAGFSALDAQFHTEHLAQFGVEEMARDDYHDLLVTLIDADADFAGAPDQFSTTAVSQSITHTS